jgi:glycosyltransferase involved in cell wall biosynthesis
MAMITPKDSAGTCMQTSEQSTTQIGNIVHVLWNMEIGGAERALYQLVREQRARGIEADVMLGSRAGLYGEMARETGARVVELGRSGTYDPTGGRRVRALLEGYSIIHFHCAEPALIHMASRVPGLRRVYTHRAGLFHYAGKQLLRYRITGRYLRKRFHAFSGNTSQACDAASALFGIPRDRFTTTYNGIDFSLLAPTRDRRDVLRELGDERGDVVRIGTSANLRRLKRIHLIFEAMARIGTERLHLHVLGDGPARAELEAAARDLGVADAVTFAGKKERIGDYLQLFDIFALPSGPEESFGNSAVEAMGVGIPTIVFADGGGLVEHIENGRDGFIVGDVPELASVIRDLAADPALRARIAAAARDAMHERYSLSSMITRYSALYERGVQN